MIRQSLFLCVGAAALFAAGAALAKPDKPINAAETDSGEGCLVRDANGDYHTDNACQWHIIVKRDKNGAFVSASYQDKGTLPEGAPRPDKALKTTTIYDGCTTGAEELTTPSGQYSSSCHIRQ